MQPDYGQRLNEAVATELRAYRAAARISQRKLVELTGISLSKILRLEAAKIDIGTRDIALITDALGVEPRELMERAQTRTETSAPREPIK